MYAKTILVTGGAGFVGSNLCRRLAAMGCKVISLDNYFTGSRDNHVEAVEYRDGHTKDIERLVPDQVDLVYHLGEYSRVEKSLEDPPELVWEMNKTGTFAVLEFCRKRGCKVVYAGSSTKFSDNGLGRDLTPYTWTKATNTELVCNYGRWFGLSYAITYFYNVYGPGEISHGPYSTLIGIFCEEHKNGQPLTVVAPGTQVRGFTHVDDIVEGLVLVGDKGQGDEFGIGAAENFTILDVAKMFGGEIIMLPERAGNRLTSNADTSRVRALGWEQKKKLDGYIAEFVGKTKMADKSEKRVLVFSTTFFPVAGPAEEALLELMSRMPDVKFDVITSAYTPEAAQTAPTMPNVTVHRLGNGTPWDKFRLPILGLQKAKELAAQNRYLFAWSIMASYAALAAIMFRRGTDLPLLISLADQRLEGVPWHLRFLLANILKGADQISATASSQESFARRWASHARLTASNRTGDVFANQIRFVYNAILKQKAKPSVTPKI
jgi:UDP-glucose 4-epimerase